MSLPYFIGTTNAIIESHLSLLPEPEAPSNYKDPAKIAQAVADKRQKQRETAINMPFYGTLSSIVILDSNGKMMLTKALPSAEAAGDVIDLLNDRFLEDRNSDHWLTNIAAFGINIQDRMRQLAVMGALINKPLNAYFWYHDHMSPRNVVDPFDYILKKEHQENLPPWRLAEYIGLPVPSSLYTDGTRQAQFTQQLVTRFGIAE